MEGKIEGGEILKFCLPPPQCPLFSQYFDNKEKYCKNTIEHKTEVFMHILVSGFIVHRDYIVNMQQKWPHMA